MRKHSLLTHPNYYGMGMDLEASIAYAHTHKIPVLVDEAHGAHFCLGGSISTVSVSIWCRYCSSFCA
ncbi:hypothetical protein [Bacillus anthracis]|uniref:hypothetical protein n=1 Tax=Bacillus anthracis TaxID=1392 RepID=UPI00396F38C0